MRASRYGIASLLILVSSIFSTAFAADFYISAIGSPGSFACGGVINPANTYSADVAWASPASMTGQDKEDRAIDLRLHDPCKLLAACSWQGNQ